ncbi:MAG: response regulator transcription factor [Anaerolineales bacterium]|nr:response regulator transcription factor [Anaerolineales bacterium]
MKRTLRIVLADDHDVVRIGLRMVLEQDEANRVVAEAATAEGALQACEAHQPDVVILDVRMPPGASGLEACRAIVSRWPETQVIMLTSYADDGVIADAVEAGAVGYLLKAGDPRDISRALDAVREGASVLDPAVTRRVLALLRGRSTPTADPLKALTTREREILALVAEGRSNADIAEHLVLSEKTVRNHLSGVFEKLGVSNRIEAAALAARHHLPPPG